MYSCTNPEKKNKQARLRLIQGKEIERFKPVKDTRSSVKKRKKRPTFVATPLVAVEMLHLNG